MHGQELKIWCWEEAKAQRSECVDIIEYAERLHRFIAEEEPDIHYGMEIPDFFEDPHKEPEETKQEIKEKELEVREGIETAPWKDEELDVDDTEEPNEGPEDDAPVVSKDLSPVQAEIMDMVCSYHDASGKPMLAAPLCDRTGKKVDNINAVLRVLGDKGFVERVIFERKPGQVGITPLRYIPLKRSDGTKYERDMDVAKQELDKLPPDPEITKCPTKHALGYEPNNHPGSVQYR